MDGSLAMIQRLLLLFAILVSAPALAFGQGRPARAGEIDGIVTSQSGTIRLGGAQIVVRDASDREVSTVLSEGDGTFRVVALPEGRYRMIVSLAGFGTTVVAAAATVGGTTE